MAQSKILFVCLGNICRSPMAEAVFSKIVRDKQLQDLFLIDSAGTYGGHTGELPDHRMRIQAQLRGYTMTHRSRQVHPNDFAQFDLLIAMDDHNYGELIQLAPSIEAQQKVHRMAHFFSHPHYDHVPDPYYSGVEGFKLVIDLLEEGCINLFNSINRDAKSRK